MIKRVLFAALVFAAPVCLVSAQDAKVSVDMMGIGGMSCAHWRSTQEHLSEGTVWIYGFWTGLSSSQFDPNVWSGRALQEVSSIWRQRSCINVSGL